MKFDWEHKEEIEMKHLYTDQLFDYYQVNLIYPDIRLGYYFEVISQMDTIVYTESGIFKQLVIKAHERGIRIVLDAVFNHCSEKALQLQDVLRKGEESLYKDWSCIKSYPITQSPPNYETFANLGFMPKLNTDNIEVQTYLLSVVKYWTENYGIDGWRLDVSDELSQDF